MSAEAAQLREISRLSRRSAFAIALLIAAAIVAILGSLRWVGYQGTDDGQYVDAALAWYHRVPQIDRSTWTWGLRYPVIFAIDTAFWLFGVNVFAVGAAMLAYLFALVAVSIWMLQRWFGFVESVIFAIIFCGMPGVIVLATIANDDITELFYVAASVACFCAAFDSTYRRYLLVAAGIAAGLAFAVRETTAGLIIAYGLLFLFRPGIRRSDYFLIGAGFVIVILAEMAYFTIETGNPLWRFMLDFSREPNLNRAVALAPKHFIDREGNLGIGGPAGTEFFMFFFSQKYALIFYAMLGVVPGLARSAWTSSQKTVLIVLGTLFIAWAGFVIGNVKLLDLVPRFIVVTAWVAAMLAAIGLARLRRNHLGLVVLSLLALIMSEAVCLYLENTDPSQASFAAIDLALQTHDPVYTNTATKLRGRFVAQIDGVADKIRIGKPTPGSLYVLAPDDLKRCDYGGCDADRAVLSGFNHWKEIERIVPRPRAIGSLLDMIGVTHLIPPEFRKKIVQPNSGVVIYRVP